MHEREGMDGQFARRRRTVKASDAHGIIDGRALSFFGQTRRWRRMNVSPELAVSIARYHGRNTIQSHLFFGTAHVFQSAEPLQSLLHRHGRKNEERNHRSRPPRKEWASALQGVEGQQRATPIVAAAPEAPPRARMQTRGAPGIVHPRQNRQHA